MVTVTVSVPPGLAESVLLELVADRMAHALLAAVPGVRRKVSAAVSESIRLSPAYQALLHGRLRHELGVVEAEPVLDAVASNVAGGVVVTSLGARRSGAGLAGGLRIEILKKDYSEVLGVPGASFTSENGYDVDWLKWLTLEGDRIIVSDHRFVAAPIPESRTGLGIMMPQGSWKVPFEYSGTANDNWIVRALLGAGPAVEEIVGREVRRAL